MGYDYEPDSAFWTVKGKSNISRFLAEKEKADRFGRGPTPRVTAI